ncbi:MAG TPA: hydrogenase maturation protease [Chloroflexota bacterium]
MSRRILVAGIGNVFLGDDGFGVEVVRRLADRPQPDGVQVVDFGIRGMDLVYALMGDHDAVIFVDTTSRDGSPGTLYLIEPHVQETGEVTLDTHGMDPARVLGLARALGAKPVQTFVVACEPARLLGSDDDPDVLMELTQPVRSAMDDAVTMVESLIEQINGEDRARALQAQLEFHQERR